MGAGKPTDYQIRAAGERLNAARRAAYANVGPVPVLMEIRAAMDLLGVKEERLR